MAILVFLHAAVQAGTPLLFATIGEILTEKSGNLNLGVEGLMLIGAVFGFLAGDLTQSPLIAVISAALAGALCGLLFAWLTVSLRANQVVTGLSITILGTGLSGFIGRGLMGKVMSESFTHVFRLIEVPLLSKIPLIGPIFFKQNIFVLSGYVCAILLGIYLNKTRLGLNLRIIGENPYAADASGIQVSLYKYVHIAVGGALCALGGAYLSLVYVPAWQEQITAGRGWIAVALVIFSSWSPNKAIFGAFLFGGLDIIGFRIQQFNLPISQYLIDMLPYVVTISALIYMSISKSGSGNAPEALSEPYFREERY